MILYLTSKGLLSRSFEQRSSEFVLILPTVSKTNILASILAHEPSKHRKNQKYRSKIFFEFCKVEKVTSLDGGG